MSSPSLDDLASVLQDLQRTDSPVRDGGVVSPRENLQEREVRHSSSDSSFTQVEHQFDSQTLRRELDTGESPGPTSTLLSVPPAMPLLSSQRKYRLWMVPDDLEHMCFKVIGQGSTFCINKRCSKAHRSNKQLSPVPGEIFVLKAPSVAFVTPSIDSKVLSQEVIEKWFDQSSTLDDWYQRFLLVKEEVENPELRLPSQKISNLDIQAKNEFVSTALAFKTPRKKTVSIPNTLAISVPEYLTLSDQIDSTQNIYTVLNERFSNLSLILESMFESNQNQNSLNIEGLQSFDLKIERLQNSLGSRPVDLHPNFQAPNIWLSTALIAEAVTATSSLDLVSRTEILQLIDEKFDNSSISTCVRLCLEPLERRMNSYNKFTVDAIQILNKKISTNGSSSDRYSQQSEDLDQREKRIWSKVNDLNLQVNSLRSSNDETAIKFGQLGLRNVKELSSWMEIHFPNEDYGYLVDCHIVFEHVHVQISGQKLMSNLEKIYKMSLRSNNQALAITSFESRLPRFFSTDSKNYIRKDESYFPAIKSWDDWDLPNDGHRDRLKQELHLFKTGHQFLLDTELTPLSPYHTLCQLALTESVAWVEGVCKFIDETYNEYARSRYGNKRAWHITTRLGKALLDKIAGPRNSVHNSFKISKPFEVSKAITYASLRSLDLMMDIASFNFKNSPIVTAELSKFLALNSNFEIVEQLSIKMKALENDNLNLKKEVKKAEAAASTASNKYDSTFKSTVEDLKRRLKSLENRS